MTVTEHRHEHRRSPAARGSAFEWELSVDWLIIASILGVSALIVHSVITSRRSGEPWRPIIWHGLFLLSVLGIAVVGFTGFVMFAAPFVIVTAVMYFFEEKRTWFGKAIPIYIVLAAAGEIEWLPSLPREWNHIALFILCCVLLGAGIVVILRSSTSLRRTQAPLLALCALAIVANLALGTWIDIRLLHGQLVMDWWLGGCAALGVLGIGLFLGMTVETWLQRRAASRGAQPPIESNGAQA